MKLLVGDGRTLVVYDLGPIVMRVTTRPGGPPIKLNGRFVLDDDAARATIRAILSVGAYDNERVG